MRVSVEEPVEHSVMVAEGDWLREPLGLGETEPVGDWVAEVQGEPERDTVMVPVMVGVYE